MIFRKDYWGKSTLNKCSSFIRGVTYSNRDEVDVNGHCILRANNISLDNKVNLDDIKHISSELKLSEEKRLKKNDILICTASGSVDHIGKVAFFEEDSHYFAGGFMGIIRANSDIIIPYFLYSVFLIPIFVKLLKSQRAGTNIQNLKFSDIENNEIPLPPHEEQTQIVKLFQSIDTAIEQVEEQGQRLKVLWKNLINGFVNEKPKFGNLLSDKTLRKVSYREVAKKIMQKIDPLKYGIERMVAGENLESENFKISTWGDVRREFIGPAFHVLFQPGDILYGSRRTYLKKVALADFEGVCANTTFVIRAEEDILLQSLLKHIMLSDQFTEYSVGASKGSTNPYINWKDLDNFSFFIPDIETQKKITVELDKIIDIIQLHKIQAKNLKKLKQQLLNEILG